MGGASSFGIDAGFQYFMNGKVDWDSAVISGCFGAASGALGGTAEPLASQVLGNIALSEGQSVLKNPDEDLLQFGMDSFTGFASGLVGGTGSQDLVHYTGGFKNQPSIFSKSLRSKQMAKSTAKSVIRSSTVQVGSNIVNVVVSYCHGGRIKAFEN